MVVIEGQASADHGIQDDSTRPDVYLRTAIAQPADNFWSGVVWRTAGCFERQRVTHDVGETEIDQTDVVMVVKQ